MEPLIDFVSGAWNQSWVRVLCILLGAMLSAWFIRAGLLKLVKKMTEASENSVDDILTEHMRHPLYLSVLILGIAWASHELDQTLIQQKYIDAALWTFTLILWAKALGKILHEVLRELAEKSEDSGVIQERTLPLFDLLSRTSIWALAVYLGFLAWEIDVTAWLASAGVVGIAVGFAAKDSLANLFSGIWILADGPFKVGDFINLEDNLRGQVTHIGIRSTRLLTLDEVEITVPNSLIAAGRIVNESGGPGPQHRIHLHVSVAYGSDPTDVSRVLLECCIGIPYVSDSRPPRVIFRAFGASGLDFDVLVWLTDPMMREVVIDAANTRIYEALNGANIEIPYDKLDLYVKSTPVESGSASLGL